MTKRQRERGIKDIDLYREEDREMKREREIEMMIKNTEREREGYRDIEVDKE